MLDKEFAGDGELLGAVVGTFGAIGDEGVEGVGVGMVEEVEQELGFASVVVVERSGEERVDLVGQLGVLLEVDGVEAVWWDRK